MDVRLFISQEHLNNYAETLTNEEILIHARELNRLSSTLLRIYRSVKQFSLCTIPLLKTADNAVVSNDLSEEKAIANKLRMYTSHFNINNIVNEEDLDYFIPTGKDEMGNPISLRGLVENIDMFTTDLKNGANRCRIVNTIFYPMFIRADDYIIDMATEMFHICEVIIDAYLDHQRTIMNTNIRYVIKDLRRFVFDMLHEREENGTTNTNIYEDAIEVVDFIKELAMFIESVRFVLLNNMDKMEPSYEMIENIYSNANFKTNTIQDKSEEQSKQQLKNLKSSSELLN